VAAIRLHRAALQRQADSDYRRGRQAEADADRPLAIHYYRSAIRNATGALRDEIAERLTALSPTSR
jgi:hypothetical protein